MTRAKGLKNIFKNLRDKRKHNIKWHFRANFAGKIMRAYFKEIKEATLNGYEFKLPMDFGTAYIKQEDRKKVLTRKSKISNTELSDYNVKRIGKAYKFVIEGGFIKKSGYKVESTRIDKKILGKRLCNTNIEYRTTLISI